MQHESRLPHDTDAPLIGWRPTFLILGALATIALILVGLSLPATKREPDDHQHASVKKILTRIAPVAVLAGAFLFLLGDGSLYAYIAPLAALSGFGDDPSLLLLLFGLASIVGIWATGLVIDKHLRSALFTGLIVLLCAFVPMGIAPSVTAVLIVGTLIWGTIFGGMPTVLQTALLRKVKPQEIEIASSLLITVYNGGVAAGSFVGGLVLEAISPCRGSSLAVWSRCCSRSQSPDVTFLRPTPTHPSAKLLYRNSVAVT